MDSLQSWADCADRCSAPEKESLMASSSKGNRVFMHPSRETINRDLQLYWKHQKMAFSSFRVNSEVSNQIKIYHTVDSTFLEPASDILHRTDRKGLAEKSQMCPFINNRLHFAWEDTPLYHTSPALTTVQKSGRSGTCSYSTIWRILDRHQTRARTEGMEKPPGYGLDADVPEGGCTTQWAVHPSAREDSSFLGLCVS